MIAPRNQPRHKILAGNWKMHLSPGEALAYFNDLASLLRQESSSAPHSQIHQVIFPVAYCLTPHVEQAAAQTYCMLGAQNIHWEEKGAFTGELSGVGLKHIGIQWCLIAHSERRQYFGETDETAGRRFDQACTLGLNVIFCIGERLEERERQETETVLSRQLAPFISVMKKHGVHQNSPHAPLWAIAYEPVWAIGTGRTATPEQAQAAHHFIRKTLTENLGPESAQHTPLLYGGSVTPENAATLLALSDVDGVLVGGASLKPDSFAKILRSLPRNAI